MAKVEIKGLAKDFGKTSVLRSLDLSIGEGEFFCLVGPSGCGKSTLLNLIAGLESPTRGELSFDGASVAGLGPRDRDVAMVFQSYALYPHMSVRENIAFPLEVKRLAKSEITSRVRETAKLLGLEALLDRRPRELSGGQQQRVALGRALIRRPKVFLMDEPLSNLDAKLRTQMRLELKRLHQEMPITTIYVTHDQEEALSLSDRMAILKDGVLQQIGTPQELYDRPANVFVGRFIGKPEMNVLEVVLAGGRVMHKGLDLKLPFELAGKLGSNGDKFQMGVRPDAVTLGVDGLSGEVDLIEPMGAETWVQVRLGESSLLARVRGKFEGAPRSAVKLRFSEAGLHFFSANGESRLAV